MTIKLRHEIHIKITNILMRICSGSFDEEAVRSLYGHLRQPAAKYGYTRDIADFFAHPEKTKGRIWDQLRQTVQALRECERLASCGQSTTGKEPKITAIPYTVIMDDLNAELTKLDLLQLQPPAYHAVALVLMSALQGSAVSLDDGEILTLHLASLADQSVELIGYRPVSVPVPSGVSGVMFPIIGMPNVFKIPLFLMGPDDPGRSVLEIAFDGGKVRSVQGCLPIRTRFPQKTGTIIVPEERTVLPGPRTVMPGISMVQPIAVDPPKKQKR